MKLQTLLCLSAVCAVTLSQCSPAANPPGVPVPTPAASATVAKAEVTVRIDYATDELLGLYESYIDKSVEYDYSVEVLFTASAAANEFSLYEVGWEEQAGDIRYFAEDVIYAADALLPETPLLAAIDQPGILPTKGISYLDEKGVKRHFLIFISGEDGSLLLEEFFPLK
jgi:hypothetical protein